MFKEIVDDARRTPDIGRSQKVTMSTLCSGELKMQNTIYIQTWGFLNFNYPKQGDFWKRHGKRRKCWLPAFSHFPHNVFYSIKEKKNHHYCIFTLSSANPFNLVLSKNLSFGKDLIHSFSTKLINMTSLGGWQHNPWRPRPLIVLKS